MKRFRFCFSFQRQFCVYRRMSSLFPYGLGLWRLEPPRASKTLYLQDVAARLGLFLSGARFATPFFSCASFSRVQFGARFTTDMFVFLFSCTRQTKYRQPIKTHVGACAREKKKHLTKKAQKHNNIDEPANTTHIHIHDKRQWRHSPATTGRRSSRQSGRRAQIHTGGLLGTTPHPQASLRWRR